MHPHRCIFWTPTRPIEKEFPLLGRTDSSRIANGADCDHWMQLAVDFGAVVLSFHKDSATTCIKDAGIAIRHLRRSVPYCRLQKEGGHCSPRSRRLLAAASAASLDGIWKPSSSRLMMQPLLGCASRRLDHGFLI